MDSNIIVGVIVCATLLSLVVIIAVMMYLDSKIQIGARVEILRGELENARKYNNALLDQLNMLRADREQECERMKVVVAKALEPAPTVGIKTEGNK